MPENQIKPNPFFLLFNIHPNLQIYIYIYILSIYLSIYIVIHRQTVSFYQNSSVWLDPQDAGIETRPALR